MDDPSFSPARDSDPLIGELIDGRYRIERVLGTGGTGTVYLAEHVMMEKRVALKVLHETHAVISSAMDRFQREAIALARIEHPNVVSATDFGKLPNGAYYLALEYVEGFNLGELLAREGALPEARALRIAYQVAGALGAAHSQGIVHRDLKPLNVMLTQIGGIEVVKVLDFGLAKLRSKLSQGSISMSLGQVFGTPHYMAPEQISGDGVDHRVDLYALGVLLYEMLSGHRPFDAKDVREVLAQQATQEPAPLPDAVPAPLRALVSELLAKDKTERPDSALDVAARLEASLAAASGESPPLWRRPVQLGNHQVPLWLLALPVAAFVGLFLLGILVGEDDDELGPVASASAEPPVDGQATRTAVVVPPPVDPTPALMAEAEFGEEAALAELSKVPPADRDRALWVVLAKGRFAQKRGVDAVELLRQALVQDRTLADDEEVALLLRRGAAEPDASKLALATAAELLGSRGVDLLFSVWADTKHRTPTTVLAEQYLQKEDVRGRASPALKVALTLRDETDCVEVRRLLEEVSKVGDTRSLKPLTQFRKQRGCGAAKREDCYACLRKDELLESAIAQAAERVGPKY